jgi:hypothetical protein
VRVMSSGGEQWLRRVREVHATSPGVVLAGAARRVDAGSPKVREIGTTGFELIV